MFKVSTKVHVITLTQILFGSVFPNFQVYDNCLIIFVNDF